MLLDILHYILYIVVGVGCTVIAFEYFKAKRYVMAAFWLALVIVEIWFICEMVIDVV